MRVLHLISSGGMYGAEAVILSLSRTLRETGAGHTSTLAAFTNSVQTNAELFAAAAREQVDAVALPCHGTLDRALPGAIRALVARLRADVVHAHGYKADLYAWAALRNTPLPLVSTCHTWYDNDRAVRLYGTLDRLVLRRFARVVAVSGEVRERLLRAGVAPQRIRTIRNGVDLRPFAECPLAKAGGAPLRVGLVGRLAPEKGVDLLVRAAALVLAERRDVLFCVAGDGPDRTTLEGLIRELRLKQNFLLPGRQEDMPAFLGSLDLLVSASRQEGLPIALLEGMAAGLPLVATRVGEVPDLVLDGITGTLVGAEDVPALASAMLALLNDPAQRRQFGAAGRERIASLYSARRMADEYLALYAEVVSDAASKGGRA